MAELTLVSSAKCFGGFQKVFSHQSHVLGCKMAFGIFFPGETLEKCEKRPLLYWLSGLSCTEANFIQKSGFQRYAAEEGVVLVNPDTSPRGCNIEGEDDSWDFGTGAGFYVDATTPKWSANYRMYSYVTQELPSLVRTNFPFLDSKCSIFGHSMGGHGALICALKNPGKYCSASAFAPISHPTRCPWGEKAFSGYLGSDRATWDAYDATELLKSYKGPALHILIDQGEEDGFLKDGQLLPEEFGRAAAEAGTRVELRMRQGYDHSYFFIASFIGDHIRHHARLLAHF